MPCHIVDYYSSQYEHPVDRVVDYPDREEENIPSDSLIKEKKEALDNIVHIADSVRDMILSNDVNDYILDKKCVKFLKSVDIVRGFNSKYFIEESQTKVDEKVIIEASNAITFALSADHSSNDSQQETLDIMRAQQIVHRFTDMNGIFKTIINKKNLDIHDLELINKYAEVELDKQLIPQLSFDPDIVRDTPDLDEDSHSFAYQEIKSVILPMINKVHNNIIDILFKMSNGLDYTKEAKDIAKSDLFTNGMVRACFSALDEDSALESRVSLHIFYMKRILNNIQSGKKISDPEINSDLAKLRAFAIMEGFKKSADVFLDIAQDVEEFSDSKIHRVNEALEFYRENVNNSLLYM